MQRMFNPRPVRIQGQNDGLSYHSIDNIALATNGSLMRKQSLSATRTLPWGHWVALGLLLVLTPIGFVHAAGMGRLNVQSQMGQPFAADIELINVSKDEFATLQANVAPTAAYEAANLRFDPALNTLRVAVAQRPNGTPYLRVTTWRPVVEPYLDLVIDLAWAGGKFRRAYSALLEPPGVADAAPAPMAETTPPAARPAPPPVARATPTAPVARPAPAPAPTIVSTPTAPPSVARAPAPPPATQSAAKAIEPAAKPEAVKPKPEPEAKPAEPAKAEPAPAQPSAPETDPAAPAAEPSPAAAVPKPAAAQRNWMDGVKDNLLSIVTGLLALLAGLGVFLISRRRGQPSAPANEPVSPVLRQEPSHPVAPPKLAATSTPAAAVTATATPAPGSSASIPTVASVTDMVDPLEEAQVYLDHGQEEQAETILREALAKQPGREDVHLKLLEILAARGDKIAFNRLAGGLHKLTYGRGELWQRAAALGYALDPANPLYPPTNKVVELPAQRESTAALDVDLDRTIPAPDAMSNTTSILLDRADDKPMDMEKTMVLTRDALQSEKPTAAPAQPPLDFNFELPAASTPAAAAPAPQPAKADNVIDFKVDLPDINLNLDDKPAPRFSRQVRDEAWEAVQQKLDLARAYQEMGDKEGALETLTEIGDDGDEAQQAEMRSMMEALRSA